MSLYVFLNILKSPPTLIQKEKDYNDSKKPGLCNLLPLGGRSGGGWI